MSTPVTYVGQQYNVPAYQDTGYAQGTGNLSSYLIALATGSLTLSGGSFTLTADADFGANFGLKSIYYKSRAANLSTVGVIRLGSAEVIGWRNNANGANLSLTTTSGDYLSFDGSGLVLTATSNQMVIGTTNTTTLTFTAPAASRTYTVPDAGGAASFVMTAGTQTLTGPKTLSATLTMSGATIAMGSQKITGLANGTASTDAAAYGQLKVIQIITGSTTTAATSTSDTYADTNLEASITPTSSSNKVLVIVSQSVDFATTGAQSIAILGLKLVRGGSDILTNGRAYGPNFGANTAVNAFPSMISMVYLDSPATTSATTYKTQFNRLTGADGTVKVQTSSSPSYITLMEVVA